MTTLILVLGFLTTPQMVPNFVNTIVMVLKPHPKAVLPGFPCFITTSDIVFQCILQQLQWLQAS